jgi:hypothetical protein
MLWCQNQHQLLCMNKPRSSALPETSRTVQNDKQCRVTPQNPVKEVPIQKPMVQPGHHVHMQKPKAHNPIVRIVHTSSKQNVPKGKPTYVQSAPSKPQVAYLRGVVTPKPIQRPQVPPAVQPPVKTSYNMRPRSVSPSGRPGPVKKPVPPLSKSVGALNTNISRTGLGYMSANSAIPLATGYTVVEATEVY